MIASRHAALRVASAALLLALAGGCFRSKLPPLEQYRLAPAANGGSLTAAAPVQGPLHGAVAISRFDTPGVYGGAPIVYRIGETGYGTYPNREWALPLGEMLGMLAEETMRRDPLGTSAIYDPPSRRHFDYEWRGSVRQFEEVNRDRQVLVSVHLEARLLRMVDDSILWIGEKKVELPVPDPTMTNIVDSLSTAARQAMRDLVLDAKTAARAFAEKDSTP